MRRLSEPLTNDELHDCSVYLGALKHGFYARFTINASVGLKLVRNRLLF